MSNLVIYDKARSVPANAQKPIKGGRLSGKTDINPMWRLKLLTELFGPCGIGWRYEIVDKRLEPAPTGEIAAFVDINLYVKQDGEWSQAIPGTGGNMFVAKEKNGPYVSDECFKMALTDAISVSCKALGVGADIYWESDTTKYNTAPDTPQNKPQSKPAKTTETNPKTEQEIERYKAMKVVNNLVKDKGWTIKQLNKGISNHFKGKNNLAQLDITEIGRLINIINNAGGDST